MNERKILEQSIADLRLALATAESKLAEIDKPKLRHGDYGMSGGCPWIKVFSCVYWIGSHEQKPSRLSDVHFVQVKLGNLIDDIKEKG